jgi:hypothetical protein
MSDSRRGFVLDIGFVDHFNIELVITLLHTLQITSAHAKSFPASSVLTSSCLVTAFNNGCSSASGFRSSLNGGALPCLRSLPRNRSACYNILTTLSHMNMLYIVSNGRMIMNDEFRSVRSLWPILNCCSIRLPGESNERHEKPAS